MRIDEGEILAVRCDTVGIENYEVNVTIFDGNSGGLVINKNDEVVSIAVKGAKYPNSIIPIKQISSLL